MKVTLISKTQPVGIETDTEGLVVYQARVSSKTPKEIRHEKPKGLLKYMLLHGHWSPFEMVNVGFNVQTTRAISAQICRHKSLSIQELSQRYKEIEWEDFGLPEIRMLGDGGNRQGSGEIAKSLLHDVANKSILESYNNYDFLIKNNVAPESARMILPMCTPTEMYLNGSLRSWIHFLAQRLDSHAQKEVREIALCIAQSIYEIFPLTVNILKESFQEHTIKQNVRITLSQDNTYYLLDLGDGNQLQLLKKDYEGLIQENENIWNPIIV